MFRKYHACIIYLLELDVIHKFLRVSLKSSTMDRNRLIECTIGQDLQ